MVPEATFTCSVCGDEAGTVRIVTGPHGPEIRRKPWPSLLILPREDAALEPFRAALDARDVRALFRLEPELTPFYCPTCDASYCSDHWDWWTVWDEEWTSWRDSVRGRCPHGHERMLED